MLTRSLSPTGVVDVAAVVARGDALAMRGRHAAAERTLRELAASLARRRAAGDAAMVLTRLGCLLAERGRAAEAVRAFESSSAMAVEAGDPIAAAEATVWQAASKADLRQLAEAEALCREVRRASGVTGSCVRWATAVLARVALWQGRKDEARALGDELLPAATIVDARTAFIEGTVVRVLLASGDVFAAGRRLDEALSGASVGMPPLAHLIAGTARLRLHAAAGHLSAAEHQYEALRVLARAARAPLRELRAGAVWVEALRRAGREDRAAPLLARLHRMGRNAPPLVRELVHRVSRPHAVPSSATTPPPVARLARLVETCRGSAGDDALPAAARVALSALGAQRVAVVGKAAVVGRAGPSVLAAAGVGCADATANHAWAAGGAVGPIDVAGGQEVAVPIRWEEHVIAALVARWDRAPADAAPWLTAAASILAPRVWDRLRRYEEESHARLGLLGTSPAIAAVRAAVARAGPAPFAVLIHGESGVGKELVARAIHASSPRHAERMCDVNCAALPDELLEAELFGYVRGAFTGAIGDRTGLFEDAHGGTMFLDEVVDLSARAQAKLLRVLQQQELRRLGESRTRRIDVRIVSASNRDPREAAAAGTFRPDLVYRLDVIRIAVPPLRERREDVVHLAHHFWRAAAARVGSTAGLGQDALEVLARYNWPGNVRELQNVLAAVAVSAPRDGRIGERDLPPHLVGARRNPPLRLDDARRACERDAVLTALARSAGHRGRAARELGLSRQGLLKLMARVGVRPGDGS